MYSFLVVTVFVSESEPQNGSGSKFFRKYWVWISIWDWIQIKHPRKSKELIYFIDLIFWRIRDLGSELDPDIRFGSEIGLEMKIECGFQWIREINRILIKDWPSLFRERAQGQKKIFWKIWGVHRWPFATQTVLDMSCRSKDQIINSKSSLNDGFGIMLGYPLTISLNVFCYLESSFV